MHLNITEFPVEKLVRIVSDLLEAIIQANDTLTKNTVLTRFHSRAKPAISIYAYLVRILKFAPFTNEALLSLLVYFDRIAVKRHYAVNSFNVHRLLITSVVIASKFTSDVYYPNNRYAKVGGLPLLELNQLELDFLFLCEFKLYVALEDLQEYGNQLLQHAMNDTFIMPLTSPTSDQPSPLMTPTPTEKLPAFFDYSVLYSKSNRTITRKTAPSHVMNTPPTADLAAWIQKKRKAYSPLLPLAQKRFCPSPPYSAFDSRNRKDLKDNTSNLSPLLH